VAGVGLERRTFEQWALWSGTSFAAPAVAAALAAVMGLGISGDEAVARLIDDPRLLRIPCYGTVVNPTGSVWLP
jgi:hypothetical protein